MNIKKGIVCMVFMILLILSTPYLSISEANDFEINYTESSLRIIEGRQAFPDIHGSRVVWSDKRNRDSDIYYFDLENNTEIQITNNTKDQNHPKIYGDIIVYTDIRNGNWDIYMYNISSGKEHPVANNISKQTGPEIYGEWIVYCDETNGEHIYLYNIRTNNTKRITIGEETYCSPDIHQNKIVFMSGSHDIFIYDIKTEETNQITNDERRQHWPRIDNDDLIWIADGDDDGIHRCSLYYYNLSSNIITKISDTNLSLISGDLYQGFEISNKKITYFERTGKYSDLFIHYINDNSTIQLTNETVEKYTLAIDEGNIIYGSEKYNGELDLYIIKILDDIEEPIYQLGSESNPKPSDFEFIFPKEGIIEGEEQVLEVNNLHEPDSSHLVKVKWYIEGYGQVGMGRSIELNLPEGKYNLTVKGEDSNGTWYYETINIQVIAPNQEVFEIQEEILFSFFIAVSLIVFFLIFFSYFLIKKRKEKRKEKENFIKNNVDLTNFSKKSIEQVHGGKLNQSSMDELSLEEEEAFHNAIEGALKGRPLTNTKVKLKEMKVEGKLSIEGYELALKNLNNPY